MNVRDIITKNYAKWQPKAIALACGVNADRIGQDEAEDIFHEVVEYLLENAGNLTQLTESFVLDLVRRRAIDWLKRGDNQAVPISSLNLDGDEPEATPADMVDNNTPESTAIEKERLNAQRARLDAAIKTLAPQAAAVIRCRYVEELTQEQTAKELAISLSTVKTLEAQALKKLRNLLTS